jgi:hypothetical protein
MERDKALARLGLFVVEELCRDTLVEVVQVGLQGGGWVWGVWGVEVIREAC